jgi:hypothetical protein
LPEGCEPLRLISISLSIVDWKFCRGAAQNLLRGQKPHTVLDREAETLKR